MTPFLVLLFTFMYFIVEERGKESSNINLEQATFSDTFLFLCTSLLKREGRGRGGEGKPAALL